MVVATSHLARAVSSIRNLLAGSTTFQSRTDSADATEAMRHVHLYEHRHDVYIEPPPELDQSELDRPYAVIMLDDQQQYSAIYASCVGVSLLLDAAVLVILQQTARYAAAADSEHDPADSYLDFLNFVGGVVEDLDGKLGDVTAGDEYGFRSVQMIMSPVRTSPEHRQSEDYWTTWLLFGREGGQ